MSEASQGPVGAGEPRVIGLLCNWCAYAGADKAGATQAPQPAGFRVVRVMCTGRVDPQFVLQALQWGADGVVILGCHPGDCHYKEQNYRALARQRLLTRVLEQAGVDPRRCRFDFVSASSGDRYNGVVAQAVDAVGRLGPSRASPPGEKPWP